MWVLYLISENGCPIFPQDSIFQFRGKTRAVEDVVAQDQGRMVVADEVLADDERLGETVGAGLYRIGEVDPELGAVAQKADEGGLILGGCDDQDVLDSREHEHRNGVVDHGLVVYGKQLLGDPSGDGIQPGAASAGEYNAFVFHVVTPSRSRR